MITSVQMPGLPALRIVFFATVHPLSWLPAGLGSEVIEAWLAIKAYIYGIRRARRLIIFFTVRDVSSGWRTAAILGKWLRFRVMVDTVLVGADDAASLLRARWPLLTRRAARSAACFSAISTALKVSFANDLPHATVAYNPYGIDTELFRPATSDRRQFQRQAFGLEDAAFVGLFVGNVNPRKDVLSLIEGWIETASRRTDTQWILLIAGHYEAKSEYFQLVQQRLANVPRNASVRFLGARDDIPSIMTACDAYVSASTAEGLGIANVEAMASGLPVVCRHFPGIADDRKHGDAVASIVDWSPAAFAQAMDRIASPNYRQRCAADARTIAVEQFALGGRIDRLQALIRG